MARSSALASMTVAYRTLALAFEPAAARVGLAVVWCLVLAGAAVAQTTTEPAKPPPPTARTHPHDPTIWNTDAMMEDAVQQIGRRYNLNKAQEEYTRLLLVRRVRQFLELYEDEVRQLLKESIDFRLGLRPGTPDAYRDWAVRAAPLYEAAKKAILEGNTEWGEILNVEQRKLHEQDLALMKTNFDQVETVLVAWQEGKGPTGLAGGGQMNQPRPTTQGAGQVSSNPPSIVIRLMEDNWEIYVDAFIRAYKLDEKQQNAARSGILREQQAQAAGHRDKHKTEFAKIDAELRTLTPDAPSARQRREGLLARRAKLEEPIRDMFVALDRRLKGLLTKDQRTGVDPELKKKLDELFERLSKPEDEKSLLRTGVKPRPDADSPASSRPTSMPAKEDQASSQPAKGGVEASAPAKGHVATSTAPAPQTPSRESPRPQSPAGRPAQSRPATTKPAD